jgi:hypothetical protein
MSYFSELNHSSIRYKKLDENILNFYLNKKKLNKCDCDNTLFSSSLSSSTSSPSSLPSSYHESIPSASTKLHTSPLFILY